MSGFRSYVRLGSRSEGLQGLRGLLLEGCGVGGLGFWGHLGPVGYRGREMPGWSL